MGRGPFVIIAVHLVLSAGVATAFAWSFGRGPLPIAAHTLVVATWDVLLLATLASLIAALPARHVRWTRSACSLLPAATVLLQIHLYTLNVISNVSWGRNISEHLVVSFAPTVWSGREPLPVGATGISLFVLGTLAAVTAASRFWGRALDDGLRAWLPETAGTDSTRRRLRQACMASAATLAMTAIFAMGLERGIRSDNPIWRTDLVASFSARTHSPSSRRLGDTRSRSETRC